jgi:N-acyl-D-aspartate/D-glutamate deacylase
MPIKGPVCVPFDSVDIETAVARLQAAGAIYWMMDEADLRRVLQFQPTMIGSDGLPHDVHPHPRASGAPSRVSSAITAARWVSSAWNRRCAR